MHPPTRRQLCWPQVIRKLERRSWRKGDTVALGLWLARVARLVIRLEYRWSSRG